MVFVTVFIIIISRANVGNWTALRVDLSSHIHHVFFSRPSDVVKTVFVIVFTSFGASETLHVVTCGFSTYFIIFSSCVLISALSCVICYSSSFLHRKFVLSSFCSFCCIVHLLFIVVLKCTNFCVFSMLFGYNVIGGCIFHVWEKFLLILCCFEVFFSCILALYGYNRLSCF